MTKFATHHLLPLLFFALRNEWIDQTGLQAQITRLGKSSYGAYLRRLLK
jgi:hypothetical protein